MKKGFTLIELLAVIIILAVIALIATPIVLNVVDEAKNQANLQTVNGIIDTARLYYSESMLDSDKKIDVDYVNDIYPKVSVQGQKPDIGELYVNEKGLIAVAVIIDEKCYIKNFNTNVEIRNKDNCDLGFVGKDDIKPTVEFSYSGTMGNNNWYTSDSFIKVTVKDNESGPSKFIWCSTESETCDPVNEVEKIEESIAITTNTLGKKVCVKGIDIAGKESDITCSNIVKIDKTSPIFTAKAGVTTIIENDSLDTLTTFFNTPTYSISEGTTNCNITNTSSLAPGTHTITCTALGNNGLSKQLSKTINVTVLSESFYFYDTVDSSAGYKIYSLEFRNNVWNENNIFSLPTEVNFEISISNMINQNTIYYATRQGDTYSNNKFNIFKLTKTNNTWTKSTVNSVSAQYAYDIKLSSTNNTLFYAFSKDAEYSGKSSTLFIGKFNGAMPETIYTETITLNGNNPNIHFQAIDANNLIYSYVNNSNLRSICKLSYVNGSWQSTLLYQSLISDYNEASNSRYVEFFPYDENNIFQIITTITYEIKKVEIKKLTKNGDHYDVKVVTTINPAAGGSRGTRYQYFVSGANSIAYGYKLDVSSGVASKLYLQSISYNGTSWKYSLMKNVDTKIYLNELSGIRK